MPDTDGKPPPGGFDYAEMSRSALRGMVRSVLGRAAREGLPGRHHFYVSFRTDADGVEIPGWSRARHLEEMTVVLQHQFRDLEVDEDGFQVVLSFNRVESGIAVPFAALTGFADPSANFALRFAPLPESAKEEGERASKAPAEEGAKAAPSVPVAGDGRPGDADSAADKVVRLDAFRAKRPAFRGEPNGAA